MVKMTLILTAQNCQKFLDPWFKKDYFLKQLKKLCSVIPEFTHKPEFVRIQKRYYKDKWHYDNVHFWSKSIGRCSVNLFNRYFGFNDVINKYKRLQIDCESFGIKRATYTKIYRAGSIPIQFLSLPQEIIRLREQRDSIIAELKSLKDDS